MKTNKNYNYILIENTFYVNIEQRLVGLFLTLYGRTKPFSFFKRKTEIKIMNRFPGFFIRLLRVLQYTFKFYNVKKDPELRNSLPKITTKHFGQCVLKLRKGEIKIFDLKEQVVTTDFQCYIPTSEIQDRVIILEKVRNLAPRLIRWNLEERYIVESYVNFNRPFYDFYNIEKYYSEIFPMLEDIRSTSKPKIADLQIYIQNKLCYLESKVDTVPANSSDSKCGTIKSFLPFLRNSLINIENSEEPFILSHGDFWEGNILVKNNNTYIIDWETLDYRSFYFDFYFSMFMLIAKSQLKIEDAVDRLTQNLESGFTLFYRRIKQCNNCMHYKYAVSNLKEPELYRYLFYLELIHLKLHSESLTEDQIDEVTSWVRRFELYESTSGNRKECRE